MPPVPPVPPLPARPDLRPPQRGASPGPPPSGLPPPPLPPLRPRLHHTETSVLGDFATAFLPTSCAGGVKYVQAPVKYVQASVKYVQAPANIEVVLPPPPRYTAPRPHRSVPSPRRRSRGCPSPSRATRACLLDRPRARFPRRWPASWRCWGPRWRRCLRPQPSRRRGRRRRSRPVAWGAAEAGGEAGLQCSNGQRGSP